MLWIRLILFFSILIIFSEDFFHGASVSDKFGHIHHAAHWLGSAYLPKSAWGWLPITDLQYVHVGQSLSMRGGIFYLAFSPFLLHSLCCQNQSYHKTDLLLQQQSLLRHQESLFCCVFTKLHTLKWSSKTHLFVNVYQFCQLKVKLFTS